ncbi:MAG: hypothetical protein QOE90_2064 [Thermoplasmata archaeon]|jgi:hypothetical protein|nr:hypothetical protein [Thermoplasmata archaeon]
MLPRVALALCLTVCLLGTMPLGTAATPACKKDPPRATQVWPLKDGVYFYAGDATTTGFWTESNGADGLQLQDCTANGFLYLAKDTFDGASVPTSQLL